MNDPISNMKQYIAEGIRKMVPTSKSKASGPTQHTPSQILKRAQSKKLAPGRYTIGDTTVVVNYTGEPSLECGECGSQFKEYSEYAGHARRLHSIDESDRGWRELARIYQQSSTKGNLHKLLKALQRSAELPPGPIRELGIPTISAAMIRLGIWSSKVLKDPGHLRK